MRAMNKAYPKELFTFYLPHQLHLNELVEGAICQRQVVVIITASAESELVCDMNFARLYQILGYITAFDAT